MKSIHHVREIPFIDRYPRKQLSTKIHPDSSFYFEYLLENGDLLIGHNDGEYLSLPGTPHKQFDFLKFIERIDDLPKSLNNNEALFKWENYKRIRCTIEEAKEYLK
jgi:hypothetical protein